MKRTVSVVMAVYNGRMFLREQIDSILKQSEPVNEIIIIDDCSTDECDDILSKINAGNLSIRYYHHDENTGYAQTFFEALRLSEGDLIFFADQDDIWHRDKVKRYIETFNSHPSISCLSSLNILIDGGGGEIRKEKRSSKNLIHISQKDIIKQKGLRPGMSIAITKDLKKKIDRIQTEKYKAHDRLIEFVSTLEDGFYCIQEYLTFYRIHASNTSGMNLSITKLRTDLNGRIRQIDFETSYLDLISNYDGADYSVIQQCKNFYSRRKELLEKRSLIKYIMGSVSIICMYITPKIWFGDILSILKEKK